MSQFRDTADMRLSSDNTNPQATITVMMKQPEVKAITGPRDVTANMVPACDIGPREQVLAQ